MHSNYGIDWRQKIKIWMGLLLGISDIGSSDFPFLRHFFVRSITMNHISLPTPQVLPLVATKYI